MRPSITRTACTCKWSSPSLNGATGGQVPPPSTTAARRRHQSTKASTTTTSTTSSSSTSSASTATSTSSSSHTDGLGTWPNSFEPLILDSRYIGHYRDPSKHDNGTHHSSTFGLPISRRAKAAWFAPSTVNSIISKVSTTSSPPSLLPHEAATLTSSASSSSSTTTSEAHQEYDNHDPSSSSSTTTARVSKARDARREMEKAWGASSSSLSLNGSHSGSTINLNRRRNRENATGKSSSRSNSKSKKTPLKTALLMPGSGSQYVGMASFLDDFKAARETWEEAEEALSQFEKWRKDLKLHELPELKHLNLLEWPVWQKERSPTELRQIVRNGPQDELTRSSNSQPAICITSIALLRTLEQEYKIPLSTRASYFAGHSSGEYSACVASGVISFTEGVHLTRLHGLLTSRALQLSSLKTYSDHSAKDEERAQMSAIMLMGDSTPKQVEDVIRNIREEYEGNNAGLVEVASYNSSRQLVLSGSRAAVLRACEKLEYEEIAARAADLPVFAPFHCSFMAPAAEGMKHAWNHGVSAKAPRAPIVSNLDAGLVSDPEILKRDIVASIHAPVLWSSALDKMKTQEGVERFIFVGPGKALANLARKEIKSGNWKEDGERLEIGTVATQECMDLTSELCRDLMEDVAGSVVEEEGSIEVAV